MSIVLDSFGEAWERRRRMLPLALALVLFGGAAAALVLGSRLPLHWAAITLVLLTIDAHIYQRLADRTAPASAKLERALIAWTAIQSLWFALLPAMLWMDGRAPLAAAALAMWCAAAMQHLATAHGLRALAGALPVVAIMIGAPLARAMVSAQADALIAGIAIASGLASLAYASRFLRRAANENAHLQTAVSRGREVDSIKRLMFEQSMVATCLYDRDLFIVGVNARWRVLMGVRDDQVVGRHLRDVLGATPDRWMERMNRALAGEAVDFHDEAALRPEEVVYLTGQILPWRDEDGGVRGVMVCALDVSDYVSARRASEISEQRLDIALHVSRSVVWEIDLRSGALLTHGDFEPVYGRTITLDDLIPATSPLFLDEDRAMLEEIFDLRKRPDHCVFECRIVRSGGEIGWIESAVRNIRDASGRVARVIVLARDITAQKRDADAIVSAMRRAEASLDQKRALLQSALTQDGFAAESFATGAAIAPSAPRGGAPEMLARLNRLLAEIDARDVVLAKALASMRDARQAAEAANVAKSRFLASMSHELRTPLNAVIGYTEILLEDAHIESRAEEAADLQRILSAARQLLHLINEILDLSKIEAGRMQVSAGEVDLADLIARTVDTVRPLIEKNGNRLRLDIAPDLGAAQTDAFKLGQCLNNLLSNAAKFTSDGVVRLSARREEAHIVFEVEDTGIGMSPSDLERVFQPFVQADASVSEKFGGTGLGLAITRKIAAMLGGAVSARSEPGRGSVFTLKVAAQLAAQEPVARTEQGPGRRIVLIVDDEDSARDLASRAVQRLGFSPVSAASVAEGLALARACRPDLAIVDIRLPDGEGWALIEAIKADPGAADIPVIVHSVEGDHQRARALGVCAVLDKPVERDVLSAAVARFARGGEAPPRDNDPETKISKIA